MTGDINIPPPFGNSLFLICKNLIFPVSSADLLNLALKGDSPYTRINLLNLVMIIWINGLSPHVYGINTLTFPGEMQ